MKLRFASFPVLFVALSAIPAVAQSRGSNFADTAGQQTSPYQGTVVEDIIARVNDQVISRSDYERAEQELEQEARQQNWPQQQLMEQRRDLLRSLIDKQLLLSKGKELGINGETEVVKRLDEIRKQNHLESMEDLQKAAESQGVSFEDFKEQIRESVITSDVISQEVGQHIQIAPSEIQQYYNTHQQEFEHPEQVRLSEILVPTANPDDATEVADAKKKADAIEARLKSGADFATVAKADSSGPTAAQGGDLGSFKRGQLPKVLEDPSFDLPVGGTTEPLRTKQGWLILKMTDHQKAGLSPLPEVQNQIQEEIGYTKMEPAMRDYLERLRDEAYIDIRQGYTDSGATPNEQKILQGAYVPPQPKKKKHLQRARFRQLPSRTKTQTASTAAAPGAAPAGVPTLDQVNNQSASQSGSKSTSQVASAATSGTQKPGKKEKIRFGQAPRETLPGGETRTVDAGAAAPDAQQQVAANRPGGEMTVTNAQGNVIDTAGGDSDKRTKTRFSDRAKEPKAKQKADAERKKNKYTPPVATQEELAQEKRQDTALGLNGDTTKAGKKPNPAKSGPKRRMSDEDKNKQTQPSSTSNSAPASTPPAATQSAPASQGTPPAAPQS